MYSSSVIGKSVPGIDDGFASPLVRRVLGSSSAMATTLCTITLSWPLGLLNTMMSPMPTSPNGLFPLTTRMSYISRSGTMLPLDTT